MKALIPAISLLFGLLVLSSCTPEKKPIEYGSDNCHYCNMTIVDKRYGSEVVSNKGKVYKFDAVECMINFLDDGELKEENVAMKLVNSYDQPEKLFNATESYYLRSEELPSPMGFFITPFSNKASADSVKAQKGGKVYDWQSLRTEFNNFSRNMKK